MRNQSITQSLNQGGDSAVVYWSINGPINQSMFRIEEREKMVLYLFTDKSINQCLELKKGGAGDGAVFGIPINQSINV